jgi:hypothetical protein
VGLAVIAIYLESRWAFRRKNCGSRGLNLNEFDDLLVVAWLLIPAVSATLVWWSWLRDQGQWRKSRSAATLVAVTATTVNLVMLSAVVILALVTGPITPLMGITMHDVAKARPYLYHLTAKANLDNIRETRTLLPAALLMEKASRQDVDKQSQSRQIASMDFRQVALGGESSTRKLNPPRAVRRRVSPF